jgi:hypothetical protein
MRTRPICNSTKAIQVHPALTLDLVGLHSAEAHWDLFVSGANESEAATAIHGFNALQPEVFGQVNFGTSWFVDAGMVAFACRTYEQCFLPPFFRSRGEWSHVD